MGCASGDIDAASGDEMLQGKPPSMLRRTGLLVGASMETSICSWWITNGGFSPSKKWVTIIGRRKPLGPAQIRDMCLTVPNARLAKLTPFALGMDGAHAAGTKDDADEASRRHNFFSQYEMLGSSTFI